MDLQELERAEQPENWLKENLSIRNSATNGGMAIKDKPESLWTILVQNTSALLSNSRYGLIDTAVSLRLKEEHWSPITSNSSSPRSILSPTSLATMTGLWKL